jgi:hypothetical protein
MKNFVRVAVAVVLLCVIPVGCTSAQQTQVVNEIAAELPTALQLALQVATIVAAFGATGQQVDIPTVQIQNDIAELQSLVADYQKAPSSDAYSKIVTVINDVVANGETALFNASQIKDPQTKEEAVAVLGSLDAVLTIIDAAVQKTQSTQAVAATAKARTLKLGNFRSMLNQNILNDAAKKNHTTVEAWMQQEQKLGF